MEKVTESRVLELPEFRNYQKKLQRLYNELCLTLTTQKAKIAEELSRIRKGKKTIEVYRNNI